MRGADQSRRAKRWWCQRRPANDLKRLGEWLLRLGPRWADVIGGTVLEGCQILVVDGRESTALRAWCGSGELVTYAEQTEEQWLAGDWLLVHTSGNGTSGGWVSHLAGEDGT